MERLAACGIRADAKPEGRKLDGSKLSDVNLSDSNLSGAQLRDANLFRADLRGADLGGADLSGADLTAALLGVQLVVRPNGANLTGAELRGANLNGADLSETDLSDANLSGAILFWANLTSAKLNSTNLTETGLFATIFANLDLAGAISLETCHHLGHSIIDHRTLQQSGELPISFLRGVGLPERLIEYLPSIFNRSIQYYSCFISYSAKDRDFAERIHADLQNKGVRCWFAPHDLPIGDKILDAIDEAVRLRDKLLLILSKHSIKSGWVQTEVATAFEEERKRKQLVLFPIRLDNTVMKTNEAWAAQLRARNIGDFMRWKEHDAYQKSFERVLRDLASKPNDKG